MKNQKIVERLIQIVFVLSLPFFSLMVLHSAAGVAGYVVNIALTFVVAVLISGKAAKYVVAQKNTACFWIAIVAAFYVVYAYAWQGNGIYIINMLRESFENAFTAQFTTKRMVAGLIATSFPSVFVMIYCLLNLLWPYVWQFLKSLDRLEKGYLVLVFAGAVIFVSFFYLHTSVCYRPVIEGKLQVYDVLYTTDSGEIYNGDTLFRILASANDIRQPLFGVFAMPVALVGKLIAAVLFFIPEIYAIALGVLQILLEGVTVVMLLRLMGLHGKERIGCMLFFSCSYAYIIHGLMMEQYVIAYFYVILLFYIYKKSDKLNFVYFGAVSTLITSGILFGFITKAKGIKQKIIDLFKCFMIYMGIVIVCGQLPQFLGATDTIQKLMVFSGEKVTWAGKWVQFTHFFREMFWAPRGSVQTYFFPCYRVSEPTGISWVGIAILICTLCGFALSYKEWISKVAVLWVGFSAVILFVIGWGTAENGLILYALYFAWAYLILIYQFLRKILKNQVVLNVVVTCLAVTMLIRNVYELAQIYQFGITYYPTF